MSVRIRYMGNKREMAPDVAALIGEISPDKPVLDLFCGMCSVAGALAAAGRKVWVNDVQRYATLAARCLVAAGDEPPAPHTLRDLFAAPIDRNRQRLHDRFAEQLDLEAEVLAQPSVEAYTAAYAQYRHAANDDCVAAEVAALAAGRRGTPYRLATLTFAWGYLGLRQSIDLDSVRYAIETCRRRGDLSTTERQWALLALVQAASRMTTGPGHMAQYLHAANDSSLARVVALRRRDALEQFDTELDLLAPYGDRAWREGNRVMNCDALSIWPTLARHRFREAVVYADPPYSKNQYSRFYHVLETLTRYDYPSAAGRGRYRPDRFFTPFSTRRGVAAAFDRLARGAARTDSSLVLSYPSQGILSEKTGAGPADVLKRHFASVEVAIRRAARHSTLGARHGAAAGPVEELVYLARPARHAGDVRPVPTRPPLPPARRADVSDGSRKVRPPVAGQVRRAARRESQAL